MQTLGQLLHENKGVKGIRHSQDQNKVRPEKVEFPLLSEAPCKYEVTVETSGLSRGPHPAQCGHPAYHSAPHPR